MKLKIGTKLHAIREEKRLTQDEMAELLVMSKSQYARLERNETSLEVDQLATLSKTLDVPLHEFLPETFQINNSPYHSHGSLVFGNFNYYTNIDDSVRELQKENLILQKEKNHWEREREQLMKEIDFLKAMLLKVGNN